MQRRATRFDELVNELHENNDRLTLLALEPLHLLRVGVERRGGLCEEAELTEERHRLSKHAALEALEERRLRNAELRERVEEGDRRGRCG